MDITIIEKSEKEVDEKLPIRHFPKEDLVCEGCRKEIVDDECFVSHKLPYWHLSCFNSHFKKCSEMEAYLAE